MKGLGAPVGSLLCGSNSFVKAAVVTKKLLGGNMRQAGVIAAAGKYALEHNISTLKEDHRRAQITFNALGKLKYISLPKEVQTNILIMDIEKTGLSSETFISALKKRGLWISSSGGTRVRMVFYRGIKDEDATEAAKIIRNFECDLHKSFTSYKN